MRLIVLMLALWIGQAFAQEKIPLNRVIMARVPFCFTLETAMEMASTTADKGFPTANELFKSKANCAVALITFRLTHVVTYFKMSEGTLKIVEAIASEKKIYVITLSELEGLEDT